MQRVCTWLLISMLSFCKGGFVGSFEGAIEMYGVSGDVYILEDHKLKIKDFSYEGNGPDAYFYVGEWGDPGVQYGIRVPYLDPSDTSLRKFDKEDIILEIPNETLTWDLKWISVWCRKFSVNFGHAEIGVGNPNATEAPDFLNPPNTTEMSEEEALAESKFTFAGENRGSSNTLSSAFILISFVYCLTVISQINKFD